MNSRLLTCISALLLPACLCANEETEKTAQRFREVLKSIDRVVLIRNGADTDPNAKANFAIPEISGTKTITSLGETLEFESLGFACGCITSPEITFYTGTTYRFTLTLHDGVNLRCEDGPWSGDARMTDKSAASFRAWFAEHGFSGFVREATEFEERRAKGEKERAQLLSLFPEKVREVFAYENSYKMPLKEKAEQIAAAFPNRKDLVLTCWRGLSEIETWDWDVNDAHKNPIRAALDLVSEQNLQEALSALTDNDSKAWSGAYQHYFHESSMGPKKTEPSIKKVVNDEWLTRLFEHNFQTTDEQRRSLLICDLRNHPSNAALKLLKRIAQAQNPFDTANQSTLREQNLRYSLSTFALFVLAQRHIAESKPLIIKALTTAKEPGDIAALEVALALFEGPKLIRHEHLNFDDFGINRTAWGILSKAPDFNPSVELLVFASGSKCYEARRDAENLLRKRGLRILSMNEQLEEIFRAPRYHAIKTIPDLDRLIDEFKNEKETELSDKINRRILSRLLHQRAKLLLLEGRYEEARNDLENAYNEPEGCANLAFASQTLGHFYQARIAQYGEIRKEKVGKLAAEYLERRAFLNFAEGKYSAAAKEFEAAFLLYPSNLDRHRIFRHLTLILSDKTDKAGIDDWAPHLYFGKSESDLNWPDTGMRLLQGKLAEAEVLQRINSTRNSDTDDLCEAHFVISVLRRIKSDPAGEQEHLRAALATKRYTSQAFSLATVRLRELELQATAKL